MSWEWRVFLLEDKAVGLPALLGFGGYLPAEVQIITWTNFLYINFLIKHIEVCSLKAIIVFIGYYPNLPLTSPKTFAPLRKIYHEMAPFKLNPDRSEDIKQYLCSLLDKLSHNHRDYEGQLTRAKDFIQSAPVLKFELVSKRRSSSYKDGCHIEQTQLTYPHSDSAHLSICMEGTRRNIEKFLDKEMKNGRKIYDSLTADIQLCGGYPEFIATLL